MTERADIFSRLFGDSLITPIKRHMAVCNETAALLIPLFEAVLADDFERANAVREQICDREHEADQLKKNIRLNLPTGMLMSVSRNDLLELIRAQDKIANVCRDLAGLMCGRRITINETLAQGFRNAVRAASETVNALDETIERLDSLVGSSFIQSRARRLEAGVDEVDDKERASDKCEKDLRQMLFGIEDQMDPVDVMFLYQVIDLIGDVADKSQAVANRIRIVLAN